jgi:hypothetical protein
MKKIVLQTILGMAVVIGISVLWGPKIFSQHPEEKKVYQNPIPKDQSEWQMKLSSPVSPRWEYCSLPAQVYEIFDPELMVQRSFLNNALKLANNLPGNACDWCSSAYFTCWPIGENVFDRDGKTDPKNFIYVIYYGSGWKDLIAVWFDDEITIHCKKLNLPTERVEKVKLPAYDIAKRWTWIFSGAPYSCVGYAKGTVISSSSQNGYTEVITRWKGGEEYILPKDANTAISVEVGYDKINVYCE